MESEELQTLTASEPLTLEQEYAMQGMVYHSRGSAYLVSAPGPADSWRKDEDSESCLVVSPKPLLDSYLDYIELTFIILAREDPPTRNLLTPKDIACLQMVGDVNLFIKEGEESAEEGRSHVAKVGEVEVMIAGMRLCVHTSRLLIKRTEPAYRRKGLAHAAVSAFLYYVATCVLPSDPVLVTRINATNTPSIRLFEKLGFEQNKEPNYFGEIEMRFRGDQTVWEEPGVQVHHPEVTP